MLFFERGSPFFQVPCLLSAKTLILGLGAGCSLLGQSPIGTLISEQSRTAFTLEGAGARAIGLGGAFIAVADDATAVTFNPAGLAQLMRPEVSFVARGVQRNVSFQDFQTSGTGPRMDVTDSLSSNRRLDPLFASATVPLRVGGRNLVVQMSIQRAFALSESDDREFQSTPVAGSVGTPSHLKQSINQSGQIDVYSLAAAYEVSQRILLGVTWNQWRGRWDLSSSSVQTTGDNVARIAYSQNDSLDGSNFDVGVIWRWPTWSLGVVRRTGFHADYTFLTGVTSTPVVAHPPAEPMTLGLHWPATTGAGFAYRPSERWLVTADVTHTLWSTTRYMTSNSNLDGKSFFDFARTRTPNSTDLHAGAEYLIITSRNEIIPLRFGVSQEPQPVVDRITGEQRVMRRVSVGTGFKRGNLSVDLAYRYGWSSRRASQSLAIDQILAGAEPSTVGSVRIREHRIDLSTIYQLDRQPVERFLRHLFVGD